MSASLSPTASGAKTVDPLASPQRSQELKPTSAGSQSAAQAVAKVHNLAIILIGQFLLPLFLIGAGYGMGKQLSSFLKSQNAVAYTPLVGKIKNISTTAIGGVGLNIGLLCYRQASYALAQNHTLSQFVIDDLLSPALTWGYGFLNSPAVRAFLSGGDVPIADTT